MTQLTFLENQKVVPPLRYTGSKYRASKFILPFLDSVDYDEYREPFLGGGSIFFTSKLVKSIWLNDLDTDLITTFKVLANPVKRNLMIEMLTGFIPTKDSFNALREMKASTELEVAYRYFVINRTAYGGIMNKPNWGFHHYKSVQPIKWPKLINNAGKKLEHVSKFTSKDFEGVIKAKPKGLSTFLFIDPPYFKADQKRAYFHSFESKDHVRLHELLKRTSYKFCLTYDDCEEIRSLYSWANIHEKEWRYNTSNSNKATRKIGKELIITNY